MTIGKRIRDLREQNDMSQDELAIHIGITQDTVSMWETDRRLPSVQHLIKLCRVFRVHADYMLGFEDDYGVNEFSTPAPQYYSVREKTLIDMYRKLSPEMKRAVTEMLSNIKTEG